MPVMIGLAAGGALVQSIAQQQEYQQKKNNASATQRYSPWTGMKADTPVQPSILGSVASGGAQGAAMGQGIDTMNNQNNLNNSLAQWFSNPNSGANGDGAAQAMQSYNMSNGLGGGSNGNFGGAASNYSLTPYNYWNQQPTQQPTSSGLGFGW